MLRIHSFVYIVACFSMFQNVGEFGTIEPISLPSPYIKIHFFSVWDVDSKRKLWTVIYSIPCPWIVLTRVRMKLDNKQGFCRSVRLIIKFATSFVIIVIIILLLLSSLVKISNSVCTHIKLNDYV